MRHPRSRRTTRDFDFWIRGQSFVLITTSASRRPARFCWRRMPLSVVIITSKPNSSAIRRRSPLPSSAQPAHRPFRPRVRSASSATAQGCCGREESAFDACLGWDRIPQTAAGVLKDEVHLLSRDTPGNHSRNSSTVAPPSKFEKRAETGTRVPRDTQAPLTRSRRRSTAGQVVQLSIIGSLFTITITGVELGRYHLKKGVRCRKREIRDTVGSR